MKKLLHIIATPREDESRTLKVSKTFLRSFKENHPDWEIQDLNLFKEKLPELTVQRVTGKYVLLSGKELDGDLKNAWKEIVSTIGNFMSADGYLISTPMWNFGIPYKLKHYIDVILQPNYLFRYTQSGPEGLVKGRKMVIISSRGGDYSSAPAKSYDILEPYLRQAFGFVGVQDMTFINVQPMDAAGAEVRDKKIQEASVTAEKIAKIF